MKIAFFPAIALAVGTLGLSACGEEAQAPAEAATNSPAGVAVADGRLVLPAVKGNPGAIYFSVSNDSDSPVTIRNASLEGAGSAMIHQMSTADGQASMNEVMQVDVPANGQLEFKPGDLHVMAMELDETLAAGGTADVTLHFARGDKVTFPAQILAAGDER
ncbi:copper chaperone PCu(A)C [Altererythrobacter soli]|uniref:Copper chaperone PCu(A)C n=1 Tax=Croceibacterium soli TaxID=1739690 RepID=A0A6I4UYU8_9SPHN|nr:copper chaperone PCu(A)C [Croceibacterium soli]MXP42793.1 copper chaperone PCu(A)C [Croceibacterium soli]